MGGKGGTARISKFSLTNTPESDFFIKNPNLTNIFLRVGGEGVGVLLG